MKLLKPGLTILVVGFLFASFGILKTYGRSTESSADITWDRPTNISNTPENTSTDPFIMADQTGLIHLFWAEKVGAVQGNQADTLMYTTWNGISWARPIDLFFAPDTSGTPIVAYPYAVMDNVGRIHLFWMEQPNFPNYALYYSSVPAKQSLNAAEWEGERKLAEDLTGTKYSMAVQYREPGELHVIYARVRQGDNIPEERAITYLKSTDYGATWSEPVDIFSFNSIQKGGSDTRIALDSDGRIYVTWTEWDNSGNGQKIWFARSLDNGASWENPIILSERIQNEYERDWANIAVLSEGQIVVMWEGGWRAYRQAQYSNDGGATWSDPVDTFPWLIGENGFIEFARDSNGALHAFIAQRVREGYINYGDAEQEGLWHSVWEENQKWSDPVMSGGINPMVNPKVTIASGNQVVAAWYSNLHHEIMVMTGTISSAPRTDATPWHTVTPTEEALVEESITTTVMPAVDPTAVAIPNDLGLSSEDSRPGNVLVWGVSGSIVAMAIAFVIYLSRQRTK